MWCELERFIREYPDRASHHKALVKYWTLKMRLYVSVGDDPSKVHQQALDKYIMEDVIASSVAAATQTMQLSPRAQPAGPYWPSTGVPSSPNRSSSFGATRGSMRVALPPAVCFEVSEELNLAAPVSFAEAQTIGLHRVRLPRRSTGMPYTSCVPPTATSSTLPARQFAISSTTGRVLQAPRAIACTSALVAAPLSMADQRGFMSDFLGGHQYWLSRLAIFNPSILLSLSTNCLRPLPLPFLTSPKTLY